MCFACSNRGSFPLWAIALSVPPKSAATAHPRCTVVRLWVDASTRRSFAIAETALSIDCRKKSCQGTDACLRNLRAKAVVEYGDSAFQRQIRSGILRVAKRHWAVAHSMVVFAQDHLTRSRKDCGTPGRDAKTSCRARSARSVLALTAHRQGASGMRYWPAALSADPSASAHVARRLHLGRSARLTRGLSLQ